jgi:heavy metal translocating P-type ATPase
VNFELPVAKNVVTSIASGVLLVAGLLLGLAGAPQAVSTVVFWTAILVGGYYFGREALEELIFEREIGVELLMSIAAVVAAVMGQPAEGAMLVFLYSISEAAEGYTEEKTRSSVKALMELAPKVALVRRDGREEEIPAEEMLEGDIFILKPGQAAPTDGVILAGESSVNQAPVTGESVPVEKKSGEAIFAGSINGQGSLEVRATKRFADNTISRIVQMVEEAQERKGKSQRFVERFGRRYSPAVLLIGFLIAVVPPLFLGMSWEESIGRATVFIVAAAPCALVISIPIALAASLGTAARQGVLIKGGIYVEELNKVKVVALDKTGTLTTGRPEVSDVLALGGPALSDREVLALAAGIERRSEHPLAQAILRHAGEQSVEPAETDSYVALAGAGGRARQNGSTVWTGSPELFEEELGLDLGTVATVIERLQGEGKTVTLVGDEEAVWGLIAIRDNLRDNAPRAIAGLRASGIQRTIMLTGDNERTAQIIGGEAGVDEFYAALKPADKVAQVREFARRYGHVAMVGDGVNDAPAMAEATVGVAMGAAGTDVALETADVALMADDLEKLVYAFHLAGRNRRIVMQNLVLSILIISVLSLGALSGALSLPAAVLGHEVSELVVIANSLRLLRA